MEIKAIEGVFAHEQKRRMVERLSGALIERTGEQMRPFTHAFIADTPSAEWGVGGTAKSAEDRYGRTARITRWVPAGAAGRCWVQRGS
ncbi:tautomerase family protein [Streptomyces halobius]|uniref:tautomerase family protein n=1 Tax=Streptomyces halobius TaxID=2879846 RepID=UPI00200EA883|nr:tautomerase family protein [Streptomyces halobius]